MTALTELVAIARHMMNDVSQVTEEKLRRAESLITLARYVYITHPADVRAAQARAEGPLERVAISVRHCTQCNTAALPLFNIGGDWRCLRHIPEHVLFPVGLHGDELLSTGRTPPKPVR